jgi:hypothetical protein
MLQDIKKIQTYPKSLRYGITFLIVGWISHYISFSLLFGLRAETFPSNDFIKHLILGGLSCFFMIKTKPWGRWLCLMGNAIVIVSYIQWGVLKYYAQNLSFAEVIVMGLVVILFSISTYFLFQKQSAEFFKALKQSQMTGDSDR